MALTPLANGATNGVQRAAINAMFTELYAGGLTINPQSTGSGYTLVLADVSSGAKQIDMNFSVANTLTVPTNASVAIPVGTVIPVCQIGTGATSIAAASGVTFQVPADRSLTISTRYEKAYLEKVATDTWRVYCN
jgi:hypothetical protein